MGPSILTDCRQDNKNFLSDVCGSHVPIRSGIDSILFCRIATSDMWITYMVQSDPALPVILLVACIPYLFLRIAAQLELRETTTWQPAEIHMPLDPA